jgi:hypothetical protein
MADRKDFPATDVAERAATALRDARIPPGPPPGLAASTAEALLALDTTPEFIRRNERRHLMFSIARYSGVAAAGCLLVVGWLVLGGPGASRSFADVIEKVRKSESVVFLLKQKAGSGPADTHQVYVMGDHMRIQLLAIERDDNPPVVEPTPGDDTKEAELKRESELKRQSGAGPAKSHRINAAGDPKLADRVAVEGLETPPAEDPVNGAFNRIYLCNLALHQVFVLNPAKKIATSRKMVDDDMQQCVEPLLQLRAAKQQDVKRVGPEDMEGRACQVYTLSYTVNNTLWMGFTGDVEMRIWVDDKTQLPVVVRVEGVTPNAKDRWFSEMSKIDWSQPQDPDAYAAKFRVPANYKIIAQPDRPEPAPQ